MSKVLVIDIDSTIQNLALKQVEKYHLDRGDSVEWQMAIDIDNVDYAYVSCIFPENRYKCEIFKDKALIGGTGWDIHSKLPPEIESVKPRINWGFTTRGCIRKCYFCFVPEKEGYIHAVGDIYDIWDGKSKELFLMDNNILAMPEHFVKIAEQLKKENLQVDFNQGLDHRLLDKDLWLILKSLKHINEIRFAYDDIKYEKSVIKALDLMKDNGLKDWQTRWYVYVGESDTLETVMPRLELLKSYNQHAYLMRDRKVHNNPQWIALSTWTSMMGAFKMDLNRLLNENERFKPYRGYFPERYLND
jgi:hypothetical protein